MPGGSVAAGEEVEAGAEPENPVALLLADPTPDLQRELRRGDRVLGPGRSECLLGTLPAVAAEHEPLGRTEHLDVDGDRLAPRVHRVVDPARGVQTHGMALERIADVVGVLLALARRLARDHRPEHRDQPDGLTREGERFGGLALPIERVGKHGEVDHPGILETLGHASHLDVLAREPRRELPAHPPTLSARARGVNRGRALALRGDRVLSRAWTWSWRTRSPSSPEPARASAWPSSRSLPARARASSREHAASRRWRASRTSRRSPST